MSRLAAFAALAAALPACSAESVSPVDKPIEAELSVNIRETLRLRLEGAGPEIRVAIELSKGYGVAPAGARLARPGRIERFPEAAATLYTARIDGPPEPGGPCGAAPVSLALSLHRSDEGPYLGGALTARCGQGVWHGVPAEVLRLAGELRP